MIPAAPICPGQVSGPSIPSDIWTCLSTYPELGFLPGSVYQHLESHRSEAVPRQLKPVWVPRGLVVAALLKSVVPGSGELWPGQNCSIPHTPRHEGSFPKF